MNVTCRYCLVLDDIAGDFVAAMAQKNPKLKAAALQVLQVRGKHASNDILGESNLCLW